MSLTCPLSTTGAVVSQGFQMLSFPQRQRMTQYGEQTPIVHIPVPLVYVFVSPAILGCHEPWCQHAYPSVTASL